MSLVGKVIYVEDYDDIVFVTKEGVLDGTDTKIYYVEGEFSAFSIPQILLDYCVKNNRMHTVIGNI